MLPPLSLYVHVPWCEKKCPYCDFNSHALRGGALPEAEYVNALLGDLDQELADVRDRRLESVFIGGGTPSLLHPRSVAALLSGVRARIACRADMEVTLEANPGGVEAPRFSEFRDAGVNRLSIGVQSFNGESLRRIGRIHGAEAAGKAVDAAAKAGFDNFNLDLMYALPAQTPAMAEADLRTALGFGPPHLSYYQLTLEPNTYFHKHPPILPTDDAAWEMQSTAERLLEERGYQHYEVSAFARPGHQCRHNMNYWRFGDYLGIGAGAHGKLTTPAGVARCWKVKHPSAYLARATDASRVGGIRLPRADELRFEFMMNALRLTAPAPVALFESRTGQSIATMERQLQGAQREGLIVYDGEHMATTPLGRWHLNELLQRFLPTP